MCLFTVAYVSFFRIGRKSQVSNHKRGLVNQAADWSTLVGGSLMTLEGLGLFPSHLWWEGLRHKEKTQVGEIWMQ